MEDFIIVNKHPHLVDFVDYLQRKNAEALSFYPKQVFERESELGRIFLGLLNNEPCGYIYVGSGKDGNIRCHQVAIEYDVRRRLYGAALVRAMEDSAENMMCSEITLRCGFDLDANEFWKTMGYVCVSVVDGGARRMRRINVWKKFLQLNMFPNLTVPHETGKTSAAIWSKHKKTGVVSQFTRGDRLLEYRSTLVDATGGQR